MDVAQREGFGRLQTRLDGEAAALAKTLREAQATKATVRHASAELEALSAAAAASPALVSRLRGAARASPDEPRG